MLSARAFARRAVIASRLGMFLYPTLVAFFSGAGISWFSLSSFSEVSDSPPATSPASDCGGEVESADGDVERVDGAFTAIESFVAMDALEFVRSANAASRGRGAEVVVLFAGVPLVALILIRAASWFSDGRRLEGLAGISRVWPVSELISGGDDGCLSERWWLWCNNEFSA